jgi:hypothetical protein
MPLTIISSPTADLAGYIEINVTPETTDGEIGRRASRIATLDGGAVVSDAGYSEADRTIELAWEPVSAQLEAAIARLLQTYGRLQVSTRSGLFLAVPEAYRPGARQSTLRLLVVARLSI